MKCCVVGCDEEATISMGSLPLCEYHWNQACKEITLDCKIYGEENGRKV